MYVKREEESDLEVIDLTYDVGDDSIYWPIYPPVSFNILQRGINNNNGLYMEYNTFGMAEHTGTHSDAPAHFIQGGWRAHRVPPSRLVGQGVVVDVSAKVKDNHTYKLTVEDLLDWEARYGQIPKNSVVFVHTGWGERYPNKTLVFNSATGNDTDPSTFRFPSMEGDAASFLANNRTLLAVGVDVPGPDLNVDPHPAHVALLSKRVLILENVANIDRLPTKGATIVIGMIKLYDDAATFQVTYQLKILTTAVFSVVMLGKRLSRPQWVSLFFLFIGVSIIQVQSTSPSKSSVATSPNAQSPVKGLAAVIICCCLSGFANVFFEKLLKGGNQSVWLRNIQLGASGTILGALTVWIHDGSKIQTQGFLYGYDYVVWTVVALQSLGGLLVAAVIKYADNILKGFSTAGSILLSCFASVYMFDFHMTKQFVLGTTLVILAVYLYSSFPVTKPDVEIQITPPPRKPEQEP
nr:hypothetical protein BaRGS_034798 [Batillaria attramentaria]